MMIKNIKNKRVKPEAQYGSRIAGEILREYLEKSDEPLAVAYREHIAEADEEKEEEDEDQLFVNLFPNTELSVDLKLLTRKPGRLSKDVFIDGSLVYNGNQHFTFREFAPKAKKGAVQRNPIVIRGTFLNLHTRQDGSLYPCLNRPRFSKDFTFQDFCRGAAGELLYFACLVEKNTVSE